MAGAMPEPQQPDPHQADGEPLFSTLLAESPQLWDVVQDFVQTLPGKMEAIENALRVGSFEQIRRIAHDLGDRGTNCGYRVLREQAASIEQAACDHVADVLSAKVAELRELISRIRAGIERTDE